MPTTLPTLRIDIVSDVVCPWCIVGYKRLQQAMAAFDDQARFEIHWQPFELNPGLMPGGQDLREHIAQKYGAPPEASAGVRQQLTTLGNELGFHFDYFEGMRIYNTFAAHQLLYWARPEASGDPDSQTALKMQLFTAFFSERKNIEDRKVLADCVAAAGLNAGAAMAALESGELEKAVREEQSNWLDLYISGVPTFLFNGKNMLTGAQEPAVLKQAIATTLDEINAAA